MRDHLYLPMVLALGPTVGVVFGWFLDRVFHTFPWLTVALLIAGFVAAAREVWHIVKAGTNHSSES